MSIRGTDTSGWIWTGTKKACRFNVDVLDWIGNEDGLEYGMD